MRKYVYLSGKTKSAIAWIIVELIPTVVGVVLAILFENFQYLHYIYGLFGIIIFLFALLRNWRRDTKNFKTQGSIVEDRTSESFKGYKKFQKTLWIMGILNIVLSMIFWGIYLLTL